MKQREETTEGSAGKKGRWQGFWAVLLGGGLFAGVFMIVLPTVLFQNAGMLIARAVRKKALRKKEEGE